MFAQTKLKKNVHIPAHVNPTTVQNIKPAALAADTKKKYLNSALLKNDCVYFNAE